MKRFGAVIEFAATVSKEEAAAALALIRDVLKVPGETSYIERVPGTVRERTRPFQFADLVREYDDRHGGPVWYIP
jgi:hypothetical protein